ncbi:MAG: S1C family serine protease [Leptospirillia bacterium]
MKPSMTLFVSGIPLLLGLLGGVALPPSASMAQSAMPSEPPPLRTPVNGPLFANPTGSPSRLSPATIYRTLSPAVVAVAGFNEEGKGELGAGSLVTRRGDVLTNAHVIMDKETGRPFVHLFVYYKPDKLSGDPALDLRHRTSATLERYDTRLDLAILRPAAPPPFSSRISLGNASDVVPGQRVVAIGNPESGGLWSMTEGIISTQILDFEGVPGKNVFQTDAGMNRGNSGGPLLDSRGRMVGVDTAIARKAADGLAITSINFSIQSDVVARWIRDSGGWPNPAAKSTVLPSSPGTPVDTPPPAPSPPTEHPTSPKAPGTQSPLPGLVTPPHPFHAKSVLEKEMEKLENMGQSMHRNIQKELGGKALLPPN